MDNFLYATRLQEIVIVLLFIKRNFQFRMANKTIMSPYRHVSYGGNLALDSI